MPNECREYSWPCGLEHYLHISPAGAGSYKKPVTPRLDRGVQETLRSFTDCLYIVSTLGRGKEWSPAGAGSYIISSIFTRHSAGPV